MWICIGIFLDNDLVAFAHSNDILKANHATSTILARRLHPEGVPNWLIMSKAGSPFLKRWMQAYEGDWDLVNDESTWKDDSWAKMTVDTPTSLVENGDLDVKVLDGHSWFYPLASEEDGDATLKKLWFGKSWETADESYGSHVWHWDAGMRDLVAPDTVRTIDTPLFCQLRHLFDDLDGDAYVATASRKNVNCSITNAASLKRGNHRLFFDYQITHDEHDIKWVDSSGHHLHGWAPKGTPLRSNEVSGSHRMIGEHSFAVLPVPAGWDARVWTARIDLKLDPGSLDGENPIGIFKIRTEGDGDIVVRLGHEKGSNYKLNVEWRDSSRAKANEVLTQWKSQISAFIKSQDLKQVEQSWHHLAITYDRRQKGELGLFMDGAQIGTQPLPLQTTSKLGQDIWINAREWEEFDMGFRGSLRRFTMYADALTPDNVNQSISASSAISLAIPTLNLPHVPRTRFQGSLLLALIILMILSVFLLRSKKAIVRDGLWLARDKLIHFQFRWLGR